MSLFKTKELWSMRCGFSESFEASSLCVCQCQNDKTKNSILITGSTNGFLRVYQPEPQSNDSNSDLLLETQLSLPILALHTGKFTNNIGIQFAILTPTKLIVVKMALPENYELIAQYSLNLLYEHDLTVHPYSLVVGQFGQSEWDYLCVQSLNGILSFYEQEQIGVVCSVPDVLLPSPFCYLKSTDSFLICDSSWMLQSYKYQSLTNSILDNPSTSSRAKLFSDWQLALHESLLDLQSVNYDNSSIAVALGERSIYCIKDSGVLLWSKYMDYNPLCLALQVPADKSEKNDVISLVGTDGGTLLVYKNDTLRWKCKLQSAAVALKTGHFDSVDGILITLSEVGCLNLLYLGSQPIEYGFLVQQNVRNQTCMKEILSLKQQLMMHDKELDSSGLVHTSIDLEVSPVLEPAYVENEETEVDVFNARIHGCLPNIRTRPFQIMISFSSRHIRSSPSSFSCKTNDLGHFSEALQFYVPLNQRKFLSHSTDLDVVVIASLDSVAPSNRMTLSKTFTLPLNLVSKITQPVREASVKITLATNQPTANLAQLFKDLNPDHSVSNALGLEHLNNSNVTILASRQTAKYRLQSESLAAISLPLVILVQRLRLYSVDIKITLDSPLPTAELWNQIEHHHRTYKDWIDSKVSTSRATQQFHVVQKVFHSGALNTQSTDLSDLFNLIEIGHDEVMRTLADQERCYQELEIVSNVLENTIECILVLISIAGSGDLKQKQPLIQLLRQALLPVENPSDYKSWEKMAENQLTYFIQRWTNPGRPVKGDSEQAAQINQQGDVDMVKLKKRLLQALDIIVSGNGTSRHVSSVI